MTDTRIDKNIRVPQEKVYYQIYIKSLIENKLCPFIYTYEYMTYKLRKYISKYFQ